MQNITGSAVEGDNFFGREFEIEKLSRSILAFKDILLLSPRRIGKSSISLEISNRLRVTGWAAVRCDLQHARNEADFVEALELAISTLKLPRRLKKSLSQAANDFRSLTAGLKIGSLEITDSDSSSNWSDTTKALEMALVHLAESAMPVLLVVDELPIFIANLLRTEGGDQRARAVLNWLRRTQGLTREGLCWFLCGSIGLDSQVEYLGMAGVISDFEIHDLGPMTSAEAKGLIWELSKHPANPIAMTMEVADRLLEKTGWAIPCYLQLLYHALSELPPDLRSSGYPGIPDVDAAYEHLLGAHYTAKFAPWDTRLDEPFIEPDDARRARFLLGRICRHPGGLILEDLIQERLAAEPNVDLENFHRSIRRTTLLLERDGYLIRSGDSVAFRSPILREYWLRRHTT